MGDTPRQWMGLQPSMSWLISAGISTKYGFLKANKSIRNGSFLVAGVPFLRAWHRGEAIHKAFLVRAFCKVLPKMAATTIGLMFGGTCQDKACSCQGFAACILEDAMAQVTHDDDQTPASISEIAEDQEPWTLPKSSDASLSPSQAEDQELVIQEVQHNEELVIQEVQHNERAAHYHPTEAAEIANMQWATLIQHRMHSAYSIQDSVSESAPCKEEDRIWIIRFNRRPEGMHSQLARSLSLRSCRDDLEKAGLEWKLKSGAYIFVLPSQYDCVLRKLPEHKLTHSDVVVTESFEYLLEECLSTIGKGTWAKARTLVPQDASSSSGCHVTSGTHNAIAEVRHVARDWLEVSEIQRTFLCVVSPLRNATSVIQSDTNSRILNHANPRRVVDQEID